MSKLGEYFLSDKNVDRQYKRLANILGIGDESKVKGKKWLHRQMNIV